VFDNDNKEYVKMLARKRMLVVLSTLCIVLIFVLRICFIFFFNPQRTFIITETYRVTSINGSETFLNVCLPLSTGYQEITNLLVDGVDDYTVTNGNGWSELMAKVHLGGSEELVSNCLKITLTI
jgi:hypothetical protein